MGPPFQIPGHAPDTSVSTGMSGLRLNSQLFSARNQTQTWKIIKKNTPQSTISNTRATFAYHSFCDNHRLQCTSQFIVIVCCHFSKILNYYIPVKNDVIKITRTHSMAMMMGDGQN